MTAINVVFAPDRAFLMTDGAYYPETGGGVPHGFIQKAMPIPHLDCAVAVRGTAFNTGWIAQALTSTFYDFDQMMEMAGEVFPAEHQKVLDNHPGETVKPYQIVVAGWSRSEGKGTGFVFSSNEDEPFSFLDDTWNIAPLPSDDEFEVLNQAGIMKDGVDFIGLFDPVRHGIPLMEAQRRMSLTVAGYPDGEPGCIVGGHILSTEISERGITQSIIHRWDDVAMEPFKVDRRPTIVAKANPKVVAMPQGMNRKQRKRHEAMQRKGGRAA